MNARGLKLFGVGLGLLSLLAVLLYGAHTWWLGTYGRSPQPVPSVILDVDKHFKLFPPGFPPDPGDAGKKTIQGIDADHDGVRDDVQRWIYAFVPGEPRKQMALRQLARWFQQYALADDYSRAQDWASLTQANQCILETFDHDGYVESMYLQAKVLNTFARVKRFYDNDAQITPNEVAGPIHHFESPCENK